jgi:hypothetical protein
MVAKELHWVVNLMEADEVEIALAHKAKMRRHMYQALDSR